jgi:hypothetical protein
MRRIAAILLCIAMCLTMVPWVAHAEGTVQYAAVTATEPDWSDASVVTGYTNANDAKDEQDCVAVVVYSLDAAPGDPADVAGDLQLHGRTVILSNVAVSGTVYCDELYLLGESSVSPDASYVITGTSAGGSPKEALTEVANGPADGLIPAVDGAEIRCTVTGSTTTSSGAQGHEVVVEQDGFLSVDTLLEVRDMVVEEGGTVCITGGAYTNELIIQNSLSVSGTVTADNGQWLTLRPNATVSGDGLTLYQEDGVTPFTPPSEHGELTFEWNGTCWRAMGGGGGEPGGGDPGPGGSAGALTGMNTEDPDHYVVSSDCTVSPESSVDLSMCSITVTAEGTLRVEAGARVDLRGVVFTNYGEIIIDPAADSLDHGRIEVRDDRYPDEEVTHGKLENHGTITVDGNLEINDGAELVNDEHASIVVDNFLRLSGGAQLSNSGSVTGSEAGRIELFVDDGPDAEPLTVSGLSFYDSPDDPTEELRGLFYYDSDAEKWIRSEGSGGDGGDPGPGGSAGALTGMNTEDPDHYVVSSDCTVSPESSVDLSMCSITVNEDVTLTVEAGARVELRGVLFTNNGTIDIEADPAADSLDHGRIEVRDDRYYDDETGEDRVTDGKLENHGTITVGGNLEINDGAELINNEDASIVVENFLRLSGGAQLTNSGSVTGSEGGRIELFVDDGPDAEPLTVSGLSFYDSPGDAASDDPTEELRGLFYYDSDVSKWVRSGGPGGGGDDPGGEGPRPWQIYTDFGIHGWVDGPRDVDDGGDATFTLMPDEGFVVGPVTVTRQTTGTPWESVGPLTDEGDGTCSIVVMNVTEDLILSVTFVSETPPTVDSILQKSYAILVADAGSTEAVEAALRGEIDGLGYVDGYSVTVTDVDLPGDGEDYGTFRFTLTVDEATSPQTTGYIVREPSNILFKVVGEHEGLEVNEVLMADSDDAQLGVFELPAMDSGSIEVIGAYSAGIEGWMSPDVADGALAGSGRYRIVANQPFYRLQMHIANRPANPADEANWFGFDVIQADAYCVWVDASSGAGRQRTLQWELNRYAQLTTGDYTSLVFFGNDLFTLSLPPNGLGGVTEFSVPTGTFQGYTVSHNEDDTYTVEFLSDFYDRITLEITINGSVTRELHIHRVGVEINAFDLYGENRPGHVFHGTQYGSKVHYDDGTAYHIFATYCIPDGEDVPYGLYVTFTWADGSTTTEIIGAPYDPHKDPEDPVAHLFDGDRGVFVYPEHADPVDYLIYEAPTSAGAPVKVNVLVLKDDPNASGIFGGVFFGSGAGVEWQAD